MARGVAFVVSVAMSGAGCAQLAGIEETSGDARGGNAITLTRMSIGTEVVTTPLDLPGLQATYLVANAGSATGFDKVLAGNAGQGRWTVDLPEPAGIQLTVPEAMRLSQPFALPQLFAFPSRELKVLFAALEHPNRVPAPVPALLNLTVTLDVPTAGTEGFQIFTVGSWSVRDLDPTELPAVSSMMIGPLSYDFQSSRRLSGRPELDRLTREDAFLVLRYVGTALTGYAEAAPFDQIGDDVVTPTMMPVVADKMLDVRIDPATLIKRYEGVRPGVTGLQISWSLNAAPGFAAGQAAGPSLQSGTMPTAELGFSVSYANPFAGRGWNTVFTVATAETRVYTPQGTTTPVTLVAGMNQLIEASAGFELTLPAGLPVLISLDKTPLQTDGQAIARPTRFVEVTFVVDRPAGDAANPTLYGLQVFDLIPNAAATGLELQLVLSAASGEPSFQIPPETFVPGHSYTLRAMSQLGYPGLASGDLVTRTLPLAQSFLDSAVITVMP